MGLVWGYTFAGVSFHFSIYGFIAMTQTTTALSKLLFEPYKLKNLTLKNRIVMAPMTRRQSPDGVPGQNVAEYYARRAAGNTGLIISEGAFVDDTASGAIWEPTVPRLYGEAALSGWKNVIDKVHGAGGLMFPQLWHLGIKPDSSGVNPRAEDACGPSSISTDGTKIGEEPSVKRLEESIQAYIRTARNIKQLGFDGLELHGAHGYFLDQFFWEKTNKRTDKYGGTIGERARFVAEVVKSVRKEVGNDFPLILRISQWKLNAYEVKNAHNPAELEAWVTPLAEAGVDMFHCSTRRFWLPEFEGSDLNLAGWVKKITAVPTITVGSVTTNQEFGSREKSAEEGITFHDLEKRLEQKEFDLVAVGRALISNPDWANLVEHNKLNELKTFDMKMLGELN